MSNGKHCDTREPDVVKATSPVLRGADGSDAVPPTRLKYMLLFAADEDAWMALPEGDRMEAVQRIGEWYGRLAQSGRIVTGGRLQGKSSARTVRLGRAGRSAKPIVTDGPFVEAKESIGSYAVVEVSDPDEALEVAKSWPGGGAVEVRPLLEG